LKASKNTALNVSPNLQMNSWRPLHIPAIQTINKNVMTDKLLRPAFKFFLIFAFLIFPGLFFGEHILAT